MPSMLCAPCAPRYVVEAHGLVVDEASLTGEADPVKKSGDARGDPWCRSGTQVGGRQGQGGGGAGLGLGGGGGKDGWMEQEREQPVAAERLAAAPSAASCLVEGLQHGAGRPALMPPLPKPPQVTEGSGKILVLAVGEHSDWGRTMTLVMGEAEDTPLQVRRRSLPSQAQLAGIVGALSAVECAGTVMRSMED